MLHPAPLRAASLPIDIPVYSSSAASAAIDAGGRATIADAATGTLDFVPVERFAFPNSASYFRQTVVWIRIPYDERWRTGAFSVETTFDAPSATLFAHRADGGWDSDAFGMDVPYADRAVARLVPTARIPRSIDGSLYLRLSYAKDSRTLSVVNASEIDREEALANAQEPAQVFFIGVFVTLALTNLALFAFARSRMYLLYSAAMLLAAVNCGTLSYPLAWKWFWPHISPPHAVTLAFFGALVVTAIVFFTSELLKVRTFWPDVDRFLRIFAVVAAVNGVAAELWYASAHLGPVELETIFRLLLFVPYGILIVSGVRAWRDGNPYASFVVAGYAFQAIGIGFYMSDLWKLGESHSGFFSASALSVDGLLLFAALAAQLQQIQREAAEQTRVAAEQRRLAFTDGLTGVANRRAYDEALSREWDRASRDGTALALVLFDVDFFKRYNDTYGHIAGDKCLQSVAAAAQSCVRRPSDLFARYGGEEFVALLPGTDADAAYAIAESMCDAIRDLGIEHAASSLGVVSISAGVASTAAKPFAEPALPHAADEALYLAKDGGRNRVAAVGRVGVGSAIEPRAPHLTEERGVGDKALLTTLILAASIDASPAAAPSPMPEAQAIFHRTFARLESYPLAPYTVWMDTWLTKRTNTRSGDPPVSTITQWRYAVRIADGAENHTIYPVAGSALPPARVGPQFVGPFAFSLRRNKARDQPGSLQPDIPEPLKVIANVVAYPKPDYAIESGPIETLAGHRVYHLQLRPLVDGRTHNLRDLWVDVDTFDLWKAHFTSTYAPDQLLPESPTDATVWFTPVGTYWVASRVVWNWDDFQNGFAYDYDVSTERIAFPANLPDWLFDQRAYDRHAKAKDPDILAPILAGS